MPAVCFNFLLSRDPEIQTSVKFPMASSCQWKVKKVLSLMVFPDVLNAAHMARAILF